MRTSEKDIYPVRIGRLVLLMVRPEKTRQKDYREPVIAKRKRFPTVADAKVAETQWGGQLC